MMTGSSAKLTVTLFAPCGLTGGAHLEPLRAEAAHTFPILLLLVLYIAVPDRNERTFSLADVLPVKRSKTGAALGCRSTMLAI